MKSIRGFFRGSVDLFLWIHDLRPRSRCASCLILFHIWHETNVREMILFSSILTTPLKIDGLLNVLSPFKHVYFGYLCQISGEVPLKKLR